MLTVIIFILNFKLTFILYLHSFARVVFLRLHGDHVSQHVGHAAKFNGALMHICVQRHGDDVVEDVCVVWHRDGVVEAFSLTLVLH